jgi:hypothetical protein
MGPQKKRHGCLTAWLVCALIANALTVLMYTIGSALMRRAGVSIPGWALVVLSLAGVLNIIFVIAMLRWRKWGFWGCIGTFALSLVVDVVLRLTVAQILLGAVGIVVLAAVWQIGKENKGWPQLE